MDLLFAISTPIKVLFVIGLILQAVPIMLWAERRQSAKMQDRVGPTRADLPLPPFVLQFRGFMKAGALLVGIGLTVLGVVVIIDTFSPTEVDGASSVGLGAFMIVVGLVHVGVWRIFDLLIPENGKITLFGLLHSVADAMKLIWKEDFVPPNADKLMHSAAPFISVVPALITMAVVPFSDTFYPSLWNTHVPTSGVVGADVHGTALQVASLNVGILYIFAVAGTGIIGAALAGYSSDNKFSLLGGIRAASQMVSYEVTLGLSLECCAENTTPIFFGSALPALDRAARRSAAASLSAVSGATSCVASFVRTRPSRTRDSWKRRYDIMPSSHIQY